MKYIDLSMVRATVLEDPILDYLNVYGEQLGYKIDNSFSTFNENMQMSHLLGKQLNKFTELIKQDLKSRFKKEFSEGIPLTRSIGMKKGIIWNPLLVDHKLKIKTRPSMIIRKDLLIKIFGIDEDTLLNSNYYCVKITYSSVGVSSYGEYKNYTKSGIMDKISLAVQSNLLGKILGNSPEQSFVMGRRYKIDKETKNSCYDTLAIVQNESWYTEALQYLEDFRGNSIKIHDSSLKIGTNLFPNLKNVEDFPWHHAKKAIAKEIGELTGLIYVSASIRDKCVENYGITSVLDSTLSSGLLGLGNGHKMTTVKRILEQIQNTKKVSCVNPEIIEFTDNKVEFYVDFETVNGIEENFKNFPLYNGEMLIFNIGCGYKIDGVYSFKGFWLNESTKIAETAMISDFVKFMEDTCLNNGTSLDLSPVYHWTSAELTFWKDNVKLLWVDLAKIFINSGTTIEGVYNYKLKHVSRGLKKQGLIHTVWDNTFADGLAAMTGYTYIQNRNDLEAVKIKKEIMHYNAVDCKVLCEIKDFLLTFK